MDITDAGYSFVEGCVVRIDCQTGATGEMVCAIVYIEDEVCRAKDTSLWNSGRDGYCADSWLQMTAWRDWSFR